jgi:hypothetical protein
MSSVAAVDLPMSVARCPLEVRQFLEVVGVERPPPMYLGSGLPASACPVRVLPASPGAPLIVSYVHRALSRATPAFCEPCTNAVTVQVSRAVSP